MKEIWVKKTVWQRHLINESDLKDASLLLKNDTQRDYDLFVDIYDKNGKEEFDNNKYVPISENDNNHTAEIFNELGGVRWNNKNGVVVK